MKRKLFAYAFLITSTLLLTSCDFETILDGYQIVDIRTPEEFINCFKGKTIQKTAYRVKNDLDFTNYNNEFPINCEYHFCESYIDGNGHSFKGININLNQDNVGMFAESRIDFKNLVIEDAHVKVDGEYNNIGVLAGKMFGYAKDVTISGTVDAPLSNYVGGLFGKGESDEIDGCVTNIKVTGKKYVGGLVGCMDCYSKAQGFSNSTNFGEITGKEEVGGLIGQCLSATYTNDVYYDVTHQNDINEGKITGENNVGGIFGSYNVDNENKDGWDNVLLKNFTNKGEVTATLGDAGGIIANGYKITTLESCSNEESGVVTGVDNVGGIAGVVIKVLNSVNSAQITGANNIGGLVGTLNIPHKAELSNNTNYGKVFSSVGNAGGVAGLVMGNLPKGINSTVSYLLNNTNHADIEGQDAGGIVGHQTSQKIDNAVLGLLGYDVNSLILRDNSNDGIVSGHRYGGGILGYGEYIANMDDIATRNSSLVPVTRYEDESGQTNVIGRIYGYATSDGSRP